MKNCFLLVLFFVQCSFACSDEKDLYLYNIEKALEVCQFDQQAEALKNPNLREEITTLFLKIYENEKAHPEFIRCVTAQDSLFYAYQVIAKELYRKRYDTTREDFEFLRFPTQNLLKSKEAFFSSYPTLIISEEEQAKEFKTTPSHLEEALRLIEIQDEEEYLKISRGEDETPHESDEIEDEDEWDDDTPSRYALNDTHPKISKELLSVNFTLETYRPLDSTLFVFLSGGSVSMSSTSEDEEEYKEKLTQIVYELFETFALPSESVTACIEKLIEKAPRTKFGIINQIFLPKQDISKFLYLAFGGGFLHSIYDSKFEDSHHEFQMNRQEESFRTFRNFQARIIAGSLFDDPHVKILRHTLIPEAEQREYEIIVQDALDALFK